MKIIKMLGDKIYATKAKIKYDNLPADKLDKIFHDKKELYFATRNKKHYYGKNLESWEYVLWAALTTFLATMSSLICSVVFEVRVIKKHLGGLTEEQLNDLYAQSGTTNINDLAIFLTGDDGLAKVLYNSSGAADYFTNQLIVNTGTSAAVALAGVFTVIYVIPKAREYLQTRKETNLYKDMMYVSGLADKKRKTENDKVILKEGV